MKKLYISMAIICIAGGAYAAEPSTECPTGYTMVTESNTYLLDSTDECPFKYIGTADSCLSSSHGNPCYMYIPSDMEFTDDVGTYKYDKICPLTD